MMVAQLSTCSTKVVSMDAGEIRSDVFRNVQKTLSGRQSQHKAKDRGQTWPCVLPRVQKSSEFTTRDNEGTLHKHMTRFDGMVKYSQVLVE